MAKYKNSIKIFMGIFTILLIALIGPLNFFSHGFYVNEPGADYLQNHYKKIVNLSEDPFTINFSPNKKNLVGLDIYFNEVPESGSLDIQISDEENKIKDKTEVQLKVIPSKGWYKITTKAKYIPGKKYKIQLSARNYDFAPSLVKTQEPFSEENIHSKVLICYAYAKPTFRAAERVLFILFILSAYLFLNCKLSLESRLNRIKKKIAICLFLTASLSWIFAFNSIDFQNTDNLNFDGSSGLIKNVYEAEKDGVRPSTDAFGKLANLGMYFYKKDISNITDNKWNDGYSRKNASIILKNNDHTRQYSVPGNYIKFSNGRKYMIEDVTEDEENLIISLDAPMILTAEKEGNLKDAFYCNEDNSVMEPLDYYAVMIYPSQYGLQGKVFRFLSKYLSFESFGFICALSMGLVLSIVILFIEKKYNMLMASIFYASFALSPWIVRFAHEQYFVAFTWFLPIIVGLYCSINVSNKNSRIFSYVLTVITISVKCLCGYEFITSIMICTVSFLIVDFFKAIFEKEKERALLIFKTIIFMGIAALLGFFIAISMHAYLRGNGNYILGIQNIIVQDILRRTSNGNLNYLDMIYWDSLNASIWEVLCIYFHFKTQVIVGIDGNLFPIICIIPILIFVVDAKHFRENIESITLYIVFFLAAISWYCLGKGHSYIHTFFCFVLWYLGFIQVCFYIMIKKLINLVVGKKYESFDIKHSVE